MPINTLFFFHLSVLYKLGFYKLKGIKIKGKIWDDFNGRLSKQIELKLV